MQEAIVLKNVSVTYKGKKYFKDAVRDLSLTVFCGEVFGFLGPNGAGKTSTIKAIFNLIYPEQGEIVVLNKPVIDFSVRAKIGYMPEIANYYWYLTPRELLMQYAGFFQIPEKEAVQRIRKLAELMDLEDEINVLMKYFSKGMMQKVNLAQALINDPDLLILDEPTSGLDPISRMKVRDIINDLKSAGKTVFFSSHELSEVELICDRVGILKSGELIKVEKIEDIIHNKAEQQSLESYFLSLIDS